MDPHTQEDNDNMETTTNAIRCYRTGIIIAATADAFLKAWNAGDIERGRFPQSIALTMPYLKAHPDVTARVPADEQNAVKDGNRKAMATLGIVWRKGEGEGDGAYVVKADVAVPELRSRTAPKVATPGPRSAIGGGTAFPAWTSAPADPTDTEDPDVKAAMLALKAAQDAKLARVRKAEEDRKRAEDMAKARTATSAAFNPSHPAAPHGTVSVPRDALLTIARLSGAPIVLTVIVDGVTYVSDAPVPTATVSA